MRLRLLIGTAALAALVVAAAASASATVDARWRRAAYALRMPVFAPLAKYTSGTTLRNVTPQHLSTCGAVKEQVSAVYKGSAGKGVEVYEGRPRYCGDIGDVPLLDTARVHGSVARIYGYQSRNEYIVIWKERGVQILVWSHKLSPYNLGRFAGSMSVVPG